MLRPRAALLMVPLYGLAAAGILYRGRPVEASSTGASVSQPTPDRGADRSSDAGLALLRAAIAEQKKPQPAPTPLPEGKGKDLTQKNCGTCHATNVWTNQHHTRDQWSSVIDNMVSKGLHASDEDLDTITDYLTVNFGPVTSAPPAAPPPPPSGAPSSPPPAQPPAR